MKSDWDFTREVTRGMQSPVGRETGHEAGLGEEGRSPRGQSLISEATHPPRTGIQEENTWACGKHAGKIF